jgi:hypothetical protein
VGIGTTSFSEGTQPTGTISIIPNSSVSSGPLVQFAGNGRIRPASTGDRLSIDGNALFLNSTFNGNIIMATGGGNVGIGTTSATTILTIRKPIDSSAYGAGTRMIDFKSFFPGFDTETVKASIYAGVSSILESRTDNGYLAFMTADTGVLYERLRIEKNGNVGIGTITSTASLEIARANSGGIGPYLFLRNNTSVANNNAVQISFAGNSGGNATTPTAAIRVTEVGAAAATMSFHTYDGVSTFAERMRITGLGYVTTPNQPFASVGLTSDFSSVGSTIVWQQVNYNVGGFYNSSTGIFTCPVAGKYLVSIMCMTAGIDHTLDIGILINGGVSNTLVPYQSTNGGIYNQVSGMTMLSLQANDTISFRLNGGSIYGTAAGRHGSVVFALMG